MASGDRLNPFPPLVLGSTTILVDRRRPVAVLREPGAPDRVVTWPDAPLPRGAASAHLRAAPGCVWVVYTQEGSDAGDDSVSTAVRISADAEVAAVELGTLVPVGADDDGVWLSEDPYQAMSDGLPQDEALEIAGPPDWLAHAPVESREDFERAQHRGADAEGDAEVGAAAGHLLVTAPPGVDSEESLGRSTYSPAGEPEPPERLPEAPTPRSTGPVTLHRVRADARVEQIAATRTVSRVSVPRAGVLRVLFHPTGAVLTSDGHGVRYDYPERAVDIDVTAGLPTALDLDALACELTGDHDRDGGDPGRKRAVQDGDRVDLRGITGARWTLRPLGPEEVEAAVDAVRVQYAALSDPALVWSAHDGAWHRVVSDYTDVQVHDVGRWPGIEVVVDFTHQLAPSRRLRRRTRVFDDAGAPHDGRYLEVYLAETLATTDLDRLPVRRGHREV